MSELSEKELSFLNDLLTEEELLVNKYQMLAQHSSDDEIKNKYMEISNKHQEHFNSLFSQLG